MIPSIDVRAGRCVGFVRESLSTERVYASDPVAVAERWQAEGASWLHVVDVEYTLGAGTIDWATLRSIVRAVKIPLQVGGRLRRAADAIRAVEMGARRVVMGPIEDAPTPAEALSEVVVAARVVGDRVVLALDVRRAREHPAHWLLLESLAREAAARGIRWLGVADASRDGTLEGPNVESVYRLQAPGTLHLMLSGGVSSTDDLLRLRALGSTGLAYVIVGRALYDGLISFRAAQSRLRDSAD
jgi:phosphoribosylformimino-5-aminoimidazole carboxamide ribotide isomerase